jgi:hypothetical protein
MIKFKGLLYFILLSTVTFLAACGGGGGSGRGGTGTLSMSVTDAKPMLPDCQRSFKIEPFWVVGFEPHSFLF